MEDNSAAKIAKIKEIFETMEYGGDSENIAKATEWIKTKENRVFAYISSRNEAPVGDVLSLKSANTDEILCDVYVPTTPTVETILTNLGDSKNLWWETAPVTRAEILYKLGNEVEKQQSLLSQLEVAARGILTKDTKKILPLLTDYFHYYSSYSVKHSSDNPSWKPQGIVVGILSDQNPLFVLGTILGPSLAAGYKVVLQTGPRFSLIAKFLIDMATQVGVPEGTIRLVPGTADPHVFFLHEQVSIVSVFDDLHKKEFIIGNHLSKKLLNFYSSGSPLLVFDDSDVDSACHSAVDAAWAYNGMLPWSVRTILVQENISETFVQKLKHRLNKQKVGTALQKNVDISCPWDLEKLQMIVDRAKNEGAEVYQPGQNNLVPILLIGGNVFPNNVIKEDLINVPVVTLTAFRTINEAVALANNTRQGLAASVWTENTSLAHELARKLKFGTIWVNSHGNFAANVAFTPYKTSGNGHFNGSAGFNEFVQLKPLKKVNISQNNDGDLMEKAVAEAKKGQEIWAKLPRFDRARVLQAAAQKIGREGWINAIYSYVSRDSGGILSLKEFNVAVIQEPCGVIAVETLGDEESHNKKLVVAALVEGNAVVVLNDSKSAGAFYSFFGTLLPKGVLMVVPHSQEATKVAALHKELNVYFGEKSNTAFKSLPLKASNKFKVANGESWDEVREKVVLLKNVWFNVGQSFL